MKGSGMEELNEEIKQTLNLMQTDIDDGAHGELQSHLYSLLEMKRNELQQRLIESSWAEPVTHDQAKPLTAEELKAGVWWCGDTSEECRLALIGTGVDVMSRSWNDDARVQCAYKSDSKSNAMRAHAPVVLDNLKQIKRIGNEFYWGEK